MGTDMWCVVGRVKPNVKATSTPRTELSVLGRQVRFEDLEIYSGDETNLSRKYALYYFLGDIYHPDPEEPETYIADLNERHAATAAFLEWLNEEYSKAPVQFPNKEGNYGNFIGNDISNDLHFIGDRHQTMHSLKELLAFDYDQQAVDEVVGMTYRMVFPDWWFNFLKWCEQEKWEFAIFGFSY